jgi:hypothetical protein
MCQLCQLHDDGREGDDEAYAEAVMVAAFQHAVKNLIVRLALDEEEFLRRIDMSLEEFQDRFFENLADRTLKEMGELFQKIGAEITGLEMSNFGQLRDQFAERRSQKPEPSDITFKRWNPGQPDDTSEWLS